MVDGDIIHGVMDGIEDGVVDGIEDGVEEELAHLLKDGDRLLYYILTFLHIFINFFMQR
jgi:hypothetical protein